MEAKYARIDSTLQAGGILSIDDASDWEVRLTRGRIWLTLEGYSQDKWLDAGDRFRVPGAGRLVVEADRDSRIRLEPPPASALQHFLARLGSAMQRFGRALANANVFSAERLGSSRAR